MKSNPGELDKLVAYVKGSSPIVQSNQANTISTNESLVESNIKQLEIKEPIINLESSEPVPVIEKPEPFYVSLFIHGHKLSNCIIDSRASDNITPFG